MNKSLLLKWKWRILKEDKEIWSRFLLLRYHKPKLKVLAACKDALNRDDSRWWRDIILNDFKEEDLVDGFIDWVKCDLKKGNNILFWHSRRLGDQTLRVSFPHLFDCTTNNLCAVGDLIIWNNGAFSWNLEAIFGSDILIPSAPNTSTFIFIGMGSVLDEELRDLKMLLEGVEPDISATDEFHWNLTATGAFTVSSVSHLVANAKDLAWPIHTIKLLEVIWKSTISAKIRTFSWRFLTNRLPLKVQLANRGVASFTSIDCPFCSNHPESLDHLFYQCHVSNAVWNRIFIWLGDDVNLSIEEFKSFGSIQEKVKNTKIKVNLNSIWMALIWCTWYMRNTIIFDNAIFSFDEVISNIMFFSWRWVSNRESPSRINFYDWYKVPLSFTNTF
ncbi:uncharacterized protein LOC131658936 [Vicia villosa]|uniref:uncharacterized protein LOC131658936 n=1 Tax=Vicia villosa TaxID=3911 RepID=UPI00273B7EBA|nr:uncharacterized protein LOC131658936 [Vicia villosa]